MLTLLQVIVLTTRGVAHRLVPRRRLLLLRLVGGRWLLLSRSVTVLGRTAVLLIFVRGCNSLAGGRGLRLVLDAGLIRVLALSRASVFKFVLRLRDLFCILLVIKLVVLFIVRSAIVRIEIVCVFFRDGRFLGLLLILGLIGADFLRFRFIVVVSRLLASVAARESVLFGLFLRFIVIIVKLDRFALFLGWTFLRFVLSSILTRLFAFLCLLRLLLFFLAKTGSYGHTGRLFLLDISLHLPSLVHFSLE